MLKNKVYRAILFLMLMVLILTACQAEAPQEEACPIDLTTGEYTEDCLPILNEDETEATAYPVEEIITVIGDDSAYPITEADLSLLLKTWRLTTYAEDGVESKPPFRFVTFYDDGGYAIATEPDLLTGNWTTVLREEESTLILDSGTDQEVQYQIIDLGEAELHLRTWQDDVQIDEGYEPDDSACVCD
jgi:hypothetical protein